MKIYFGSTENRACYYKNMSVEETVVCCKTLLKHTYVHVPRAQNALFLMLKQYIYIYTYTYTYRLRRIKTFRSTTARIYDGGTIRLKYYIIILTIVLQLHTIFSIVTYCTGLQPRSNRLYHIAQVCSGLYCIISVCVITRSHNDKIA